MPEAIFHGEPGGTKSKGNLHLVVQEFLRALATPYTYNPFRNHYILFGFCWGIPIVLFSIYVDLLIHGGVHHSFADIFGSHAFHLFALAHPFIFAVIFGALGTIRNEKTTRIQRIISSLEDEVEAKTKELTQSYSATVMALAQAIETKDPYTRGHCHRVRDLAVATAKQMKMFSLEECQNLEFACILHDVGKIFLPDQILGKDGRLTEEEFSYIKLHPEDGARILAGIPQFEEVREIILQHHERLDGRGYPNGLRGGKIQILSRILAVADAFDAMTSDRPYRKALPYATALERIHTEAGRQFDSQVVKAFAQVIGSPETAETLVLVNSE